MFAPRSRNANENTMFSTQTPGPSRSRMLSPVKGTAGKQRAFGDENHGSSSPLKSMIGSHSPVKQAAVTPGPSTNKRLALAPKTPAAGPSGLRFALGDKTNNNAKTPFGRQQQRDGGAGDGKSPGKQRRSPTKTSPNKSMKSAVPQTPVPGSAQHDKSYSTQPSLKRGNSGPSDFGSQAQIFQTPAANVGKLGFIKQRMGEMMDAQRAGTDPIEEEPLAKDWTDGLTEAEIYPEIEYMPPSISSQPLEWEPPTQLQNMPRGKELAEMLKNPDFGAWTKIFKDDLPQGQPLRESEPDFPLTVPDDLAAAIEKTKKIENDDDDDDPFPEDKASSKARSAVARQPLAARNGSAIVRSSLSKPRSTATSSTAASSRASSLAPSSVTSNRPGVTRKISAGVAPANGKVPARPIGSSHKAGLSPAVPPKGSTSSSSASATVRKPLAPSSRPGTNLSSRAPSSVGTKLSTGTSGSRPAKASTSSAGAASINGRSAGSSSGTTSSTKPTVGKGLDTFQDDFGCDFDFDDLGLAEDGTDMVGGLEIDDEELVRGSGPMM